MTHRGKQHRNRWWLALLAAFALFAAACGDDGGEDADTGDDTDTEVPADDGSDDPADDAGTDEGDDTGDDAGTDDEGDDPGDGEGDDADGPSITVEPSTGLSGGDTVTVSGEGFTPGLQLGINLCSDQGDQTGAGDCDLGGIQIVEVAADGTVPATEYTLIAGEFGENQRVCDADNPCVLSLGELVPDPDAERATQDLEFA